MDKKMIDSNWMELKGKIKAKWSKFNDEDIESVRVDFNQLAGKIQKAYAVAKDNADRQFEDFKKSVHTLIESGATSDAPRSTTTPNANVASVAPLAAMKVDVNSPKQPPTP